LRVLPLHSARTTYFDCLLTKCLSDSDQRSLPSSFEWGPSRCPQKISRPRKPRTSSSGRISKSLTPSTICGCSAPLPINGPTVFPRRPTGELRERDFETHLIAERATPNSVPPGFKLMMPRKGEEAEYSLLFSCRPREYARAEVLQHCSSLEVNMERLAWFPNKQATTSSPSTRPARP